MDGIKRTTRKLEKFRPSTEDVVEVIHNIKKEGATLNKNQKGIINHFIIGLIFSSLTIFKYGFGTELHLLFVSFSSGAFATFGIVFSMVMWGFVRMGLL